MTIPQRNLAKPNMPQHQDIFAVKMPQAEGALKAQRVLATAQSKPRGLDNLLHGLPQLVWVTDQSGQCIYVNKTFEDFTGKPADALMNAAWTTFLHPDDVAGTTAAWLHSVQHKTAHQAQYRIRRHDGIYRWMLAGAVLVESAADQTSFWVGTNTDIHDLRQLIDSTHKSRALEQSFMNSWLHDLRVPLGIVRLNAEFALSHPDEPHRAAQNLRAVIQDVGRLDAMVADLLNDQPVQGDAQLASTPRFADLRDIVSNVVEKMSTAYPDRLAVEMTPHNLLGVWNASALKQVVESLVDNAAKYGRTNAPIEVVLARTSDQASLSVHNQLPTFDARAADPLRECTPSQGWGLGLPSVKRIAEDHGGFVQVESSTTGGTTVRVVLPLSSNPSH